MKTLPKEGEPTRARPAPARSPARTGDMSASVVTEIGSLRRRLTAAHEAERAASVLLAERLSDGKRPAGAAAGEVQPASVEAPMHMVGSGEARQKPVGRLSTTVAVAPSWRRWDHARKDLAERFLDIDPGWIARRHANLSDDLAAAATAAADRRREILARFGVDFSPFVSVRRLREQFPDYDFSSGDTLIAFLESRANRPEPASLHWLFDEKFYRTAYSEPAVELGLAPQPSYFEFLLNGIDKGRRPHPLFNPDWYRTRLALPGDVPTFVHFLREGVFEDLSPTPLFDPEFYRARYPEVETAIHNGVYSCSLEHFILKGMDRGLSPRADWDSEYYLRQNPDVAEDVNTGRTRSAVSHWIEFGLAEERAPNARFDGKLYLENYPTAADEIRRHGLLGGFEHFAIFGRERRWLAETANPEECVRASRLFDPDVYVALNPDLSRDPADAWRHFWQYGLNEGRPFTSAEVVARLLARLEDDLRTERRRYAAMAQAALVRTDDEDAAMPLRRRGFRVGVFCSSIGNFFMREIADMLAWGLAAQGVSAIQRDETAHRDEPFDLRVFVAPHEFFWLGEGREWAALAGAANSVLYNVEQAQTSWFCRAFPLLLGAPLVLDVNFQTTMLLRRAGCNAVHFMPGHLPGARYAQPCLDISEIELTKGYRFARQPYNWLDRDRLEDRPIDLLFVGTAAPRRDMALSRLQDFADAHRFLCVCTRQDAPLVGSDYRTTSTDINCALGQRAKIVLNIHRDWLGYFEWSRMVLQGFWQGACVVSDPGLPNPLFEPNAHYFEENLRNIGELLRWLLESAEGRDKLDRTRRAGYERARTLGSMRVALAPVLEAFAGLLRL
jgi:hypothetical protein